MSTQLMAFNRLSGVNVSYKYVEHLYSDPEVLLALRNLHVLVLKRKGVRGADCLRGETGYPLCIWEHYATEVRKRKKGKRNPRSRR